MQTNAVLIPAQEVMAPPTTTTHNVLRWKAFLMMMIDKLFNNPDIDIFYDHIENSNIDGALGNLTIMLQNGCTRKTYAKPREHSKLQTTFHHRERHQLSILVEYPSRSLISGLRRPGALLLGTIEEPLLLIQSGIDFWLLLDLRRPWQ